ncbi:MAG TPA: PEGA domain-containing protein [Kofleriaceae bacterium]|nr:PEGA domain-containing protein [Kofleriaceae bacterium]
MRLLGIVVLIVLAAGAARAQSPTRQGGFIGRGPPRLVIDDCPVRDRALTEDQLRALGQEHYQRGETLYLQGDYKGAVSELVASYCLIPYYSILKDIGQAYERDLDYEQAIAYLERYIREIPPDAKRANACAADPQEDKENVSRRVQVLRRLRAHISVQTQPPGGRITIENDATVAQRATAGDDIQVPGDTYTMKIELPGYETETRTIDVQIGKPYTYFVELTPLKGTVSVQVTPADARIFIDNKLVGIGRFEGKLDAKPYIVMSERQGRLTDQRTIEVLPNQVKRVQIELTPQPQFGRRQLIAFTTVGSGFATGALLYAFSNTGIAGAGSIGGAAAGFAGSYFYLPDTVTLGTSNLTITSTLAGGIIGGAGTLLFTDEPRIVQPAIGATMIAGAGIGYYVGDRTKIRPGDAALVNSSMTWGTVAGGLFALSFAPPRDVAAGLVLSGLGVGGISGVIMTRYFDISRTHALLIDIGGVVGILGGLAVESLAYPTTQAQGDELDEQTREHLANFSLGGMVVGLIGAGILTRNLDAPKLAVQPTIGNAVASDGAVIPTYGLSGSW